MKFIQRHIKYTEHNFLNLFRRKTRKNPSSNREEQRGRREVTAVLLQILNSEILFWR